LFPAIVNRASIEEASEAATFSRFTSRQLEKPLQGMRLGLLGEVRSANARISITPLLAIRINAAIEKSFPNEESRDTQRR
jgi:hypothetical protein